MLPFIEQKPAYDTLQVGTLRGRQALDLAFAATPDVAKQLVFTTPIDVYRCPSDTGPETVADSNRRVNGAGAQQSTIGSNYVAVGFAANPTAADASVSISRDPGLVLNGTFLLDRSRKMAQLTDGTSNTAWICERVYDLYDPATATIRNPRMGLALVAGGYNGTLGVGMHGATGLNIGMTDATCYLGSYAINAASSNNVTTGGVSSKHAGDARWRWGTARSGSSARTPT